MSERTAFFDSSAPWVTWEFRTPDDAIPPEGGPADIAMLCCICGERETITIQVPPTGTTFPPGWEHPERVRYKAEHAHPLQRTAPETWALPLYNPAALGHGDMVDILQDVAERARREADRG